MDPDEKSGDFQWRSINASFSFTQIESKSHELSVKVISGTFQEGSYDRSTYTWTPAPPVKVAGISQNDLWGFHKEQGKISVQPNANTIITYTTRKVVSADDTVPALKCYDRCPKYHGSNITISVSGIIGAGISGTVSNGKLISAKVSN